MKLRIRILTDEELRQANYDGWYTIPLMSSAEPDVVRSVLEYRTDNGQWIRVDVEYS